jgi:hypothetical protein
VCKCANCVSQLWQNYVSAKGRFLKYKIIIELYLNRMKLISLISLLFIAALAHAQDMRVYTVAGLNTYTGSTPLGDGGPATNAKLGNTEGIWMDGASKPIH